LEGLQWPLTVATKTGLMRPALAAATAPSRRPKYFQCTRATVRSDSRTVQPMLSLSVRRRERERKKERD